MFLSMILMLVFAIPVHSNFEGKNQSATLGVFNKINCGSNVTCTRTKNGVFDISAPAIDGDFVGNLTAVNATLSGNLIAVDGTFSDDVVVTGDVSAVKGTFTGAVTGTTGTFSGAVAGTTGTFSGAVAGTTGTFSGAVAGTTGTFTGAVSGTTGTFTGAVSGTTGTFTGDVTGDGGDQMYGFLQNQVVATATTITAGQCGSTFINSGAIEIELPEASTVIGCRLTFVTGNAANFDIDPDDADIILIQTNAAGDMIRNATLGNTITIQAISASEWVVVGILGTWADAN